LKFEFTSIPCHSTITVAVKDPNTGDDRLISVPCNGVMIPEVHEIVDGVFEVRWTCNKCGAVKGMMIGGIL
jgi:hypothetical protein